MINLMKNYEHKLFFGVLSVKTKPNTSGTNRILKLPKVLLKAKADAELQWQMI